MIPSLIKEGRRILVSSQFTGMIDLISAELTARGLHHVVLIGGTKDRAVPVEAFQSGRTGLFLLNRKAGGAGINLTAAHTAIHWDPWWKPAVENHAGNRAAR